MWIISIVSLSIVTALCLLGLYHRAFQDNFLQAIGMFLLLVSCAGRVAWIWERRFTDSGWMLVHVAIAIYAIGTAHKVILHHGRARGWGWLQRTDRWIGARLRQRSEETTQ